MGERVIPTLGWITGFIPRLYLDGDLIYVAKIFGQTTYAVRMLRSQEFVLSRTSDSEKETKTQSGSIIKLFLPGERRLRETILGSSIGNTRSPRRVIFVPNAATAVAVVHGLCFNKNAGATFPRNQYRAAFPDVPAGREVEPRNTGFRSRDPPAGSRAHIPLQHLSSNKATSFH